MNIKNFKIDSIIPYARNPRKNDGAVLKVMASIKEFGFRVPIILDRNNVIVAGHTRYLAAKKLGLDEVPVTIADELTDTQIKAFRIADNKVAEFAEWDNELLKLEFEDLENEGFDIELTGFNSEEISEIDDDEILDGLTEDDEAPSVESTSKTVLGDIWILGNHRLMCGSSIIIDNVDKLLDGEKIDLIFTDPPYNVGFNGTTSKFDIIKNDDLSTGDFNDFILEVCQTIRSIQCDNYYIFCNWKFYSILQQNLDFKACIVWAKNYFGLGNGYRHQHEFCLFNGKIDAEVKNESDLWEISKDSNYVHPTQKPVELSLRAFKNHKNKINVLDLFGGSGSTLIGCEKTGRKCFVMELDEKYCDVIIKRWQNYSGKNAINEQTGKTFNDS